MSDISSVTGSAALVPAAQALLNEYGPMFSKGAHLIEHLLDAQREAVDAFIRDELPGLLAHAYDGWLDEREIDTGNRPPLKWVAAKIAELRKEVEQRAQTS